MRLVVVACLLLALLVARLAYTAWRRRLASDRRLLPAVPASLLGNGERTWVVFTTPYCASCEPVTRRLEVTDPHADVVVVDAGVDPELADAFGVKTAPTVLLADRTGRVLHRLVGASAVEAHLESGYVRRPA